MCLKFVKNKNKNKALDVWHFSLLLDSIEKINCEWHDTWFSLQANETANEAKTDIHFFPPSKAFPVLCAGSQLVLGGLGAMPWCHCVTVNLSYIVCIELTLLLWLRSLFVPVVFFLFYLLFLNLHGFSLVVFLKNVALCSLVLKSFLLLAQQKCGVTVELILFLGAFS